MKITFLGNFSPPHSTENDLLWTLRDMGHEVETYQENAYSFSNPRPLVNPGCELFLWVHTHGWDQIEMSDVLDALRSKEIPTAAFHLDLYRGLHREPMVGEHPFFKVDWFFGVDGRSHEDGWYKERGVNHYLTRPGIVKRDCYKAEPREAYKCDVAFVGSYGYHPEHAWRRQLVDWLRKTYGDRFKKFGNPEPTLRGDELNRFYASAKVVVGDTCNLTGNHHYWSDRLYDVPGRGGFLLMPFVPGMAEEYRQGEEMSYYEMGNCEQLQRQIDYWLEHEFEREKMATAAFEHTKRDHTYHQRMQAMLETIFGKE